MRTLKDLQTKYANSPKMLEAVNRTIAEHGENSPATTASGQPSYKKGSNCWAAANFYGWSDYEVYPGARASKAKNEGYVCVIVPAKPA